MEWRSVPVWISLHFSFRSTDSVFLSAGDRSGFIETGEGREWLVDNMFLTSAVELSETMIGRDLLL